MASVAFMTPPNEALTNLVGLKTSTASTSLAYKASNEGQCVWYRTSHFASTLPFRRVWTMTAHRPAVSRYTHIELVHPSRAVANSVMKRSPSASLRAVQRKQRLARIGFVVKFHHAHVRYRLAIGFFLCIAFNDQKSPAFGLLVHVAPVVTTDAGVQRILLVEVGMITDADR